MTELEKEKKGFYQRICSNVNCGTVSCVKRIGRLLYSPSQGCLYCFSCRLLSKKQSAFATSGFNYWKYSNLTVDHENGVEHLKCMTAYLVWHKEAACVDSLLVKNRWSEQEYWRKVFTRVASVIRILPSRGLLFRGANQTTGHRKMETSLVF